MEQTQDKNTAPISAPAEAPREAAGHKTAAPSRFAGAPRSGGAGRSFGPGAGKPFGNRPAGDRRNAGGPRRGGSGARAERPKPEFDQKIIDIRRVARVATGGRRFSFSVALVAGNRKGSVGVGLGKASDTSLAIDKAMRNAKKNLVKANLTKGMSIPHPVEIKYSSARVSIAPAKGRGLAAGSAARNVLELAGVTDVVAKIISPSKNRLNIARATVLALSKLSTKPRPGTASK